MILVVPFHLLYFFFTHTFGALSLRQRDARPLAGRYRNLYKRCYPSETLSVLCHTLSPHSHELARVPAKLGQI